MAITLLDSLDSIGSAVGKINAISATIGDLDLVEDASGSFVDTLNSYQVTLTQFDDSSEQVILSRTALQAQDNGGHGSFTYNNATGQFDFDGQSAAIARAQLSAGSGLQFDTGALSIDSGNVVNIHFRGDAITSGLYDSTITTRFKNSAGTTLITLRTPEI